MALDLSVIITARNEEFLSRTVDGVLEAREANTNVIVLLDGKWAEPPLKDHKDVIILYYPESIGQRAGINQAVKLSTAKYIMKLDAHCIVDKGFDRVLCEAGDKLGPLVTQVPTQYNLHAFDWKCNKCGNRWYQGPTPTHCMLPGEKRGENKSCDSTEFERVMVWKPRFNRKSEHYRFDTDLHFQYWGSLGKRKGFEGDITETMSLLGACFFMNRERYWELGGSDENHGSWGQQGTEIACKTWLSGGRLVTNRKTWYAHLFRTQGGDFGFPYKHKPGAVENARDYSQNLWKNNKWDKQVRPLQWLIDRFTPVPGWHETNKGIIFYTDNRLPLKIAHKVQKQLIKASNGLKIVSASLKPMSFGENVHLPLQPGYITMTKQILEALRKLDTEIVFFCEHDVLYHPSHFEFNPERPDTYYYNTNVWRLRLSDGLAVRTNDCRQLSGLVCFRKTAIKHYERRLEILEEYEKEIENTTTMDSEPFAVRFDRYVRKMGFEPGTHNRAERVDDLQSKSYESTLPNVDIRHDGNATRSKWSPDQYRNKRYAEGWQETHNIPGWGSID